MDRVGARLPRGFQDPGDRQVGVGDGAGAESHRPVGAPHVQGIDVVRRVDGDGLDAHLARRPEDPHGDLAPVRDEERPDRPLAAAHYFLPRFPLSQSAHSE